MPTLSLEDLNRVRERKVQCERQLSSCTSDAARRALFQAWQQDELNLCTLLFRPVLTPSLFSTLAVIGRGGFGEVTLSRKDNHLYALKRVTKLTPLKHILSERNALVGLSGASSPVFPQPPPTSFVTPLYFSFQTDTDFYLATEFAVGGDLMTLLIKKDVLPEALVRLYAFELILALDCIHVAGFIHRDIKPDNVFLDRNAHIMLGDLGLSFKQEEEEEEEKGEEEGLIRAAAAASSSSSSSSSAFPHSTTSISSRRPAFSQVGTPDYIAPEILQSSTTRGGVGGYTELADWWSLGVVLYECLLGYTPFNASTPQLTCERILRWGSELSFPADRTAHLSPQCLGFLKGLLRESGSRLGGGGGGVEELKSHPWFSGGSGGGSSGGGQLLPSPSNPPLLPWGDLRSVDVRSVGGELPLGGRAGELLGKLETLETSSPEFPALLKQVLVHFDDFTHLPVTDPRYLPPPPTIILTATATATGSTASTTNSPPPYGILLPPLPLHKLQGAPNGGGGEGDTAAAAAATPSHTLPPLPSSSSARSIPSARVDFTFQRPPLRPEGGSGAGICAGTSATTATATASASAGGGGGSVTTTTIRRVVSARGNITTTTTTTTVKEGEEPNPSPRF